MYDRDVTMGRVLDAIDLGRARTVRQAAAVAGVSVRTVFRWTAANHVLQEMLHDAIYLAALRAYRDHLAEPVGPRERRPRVRWSRVCPECAGKVVVRTAWRAVGVRFYACEECAWAAWRPRALTDCPLCGGPRFWSRSRLSVGCDRCRQRWRVA
jgi:hypothetical protein